MYELAGDAKYVLIAINNLREAINRLDENHCFYWQNVKKYFEDVEGNLRDFLGKHPNFRYRDRVEKLLYEIRDVAFHADPSISRRLGNYYPKNVRKSTLTDSAKYQVYTGLNELEDLIREGYIYIEESRSSKVLSIAAITISSLFLIYTFSQTSTANVSLPAFKTASIFLSLFLLLLSSFLLLRHKLKKH